MPDPSPTPESAAANATREGDLGDALAAAEPALRAFVQRAVGGGPLRQELDDVVQDTLAKALRGAAGYDPTRPLEPWLFGIAVRAVADRYRARRAPADADLDALEDARAQRPALAIDARDEVERRLRALAAADRRLLLALHRDGRSVAEVAREAGVPVGTIKSRLSRARRALAESARARGGGAMSAEHGTGTPRRRGSEAATALDRAVDAALDAGRDPLAAAAVLDALVAEPERFDEVARLADDARALSACEADALTVAAPEIRSRTPRALLVLAAAAAALALAPFVLPGRDAPDPVVAPPPDEPRRDADGTAVAAARSDAPSDAPSDARNDAPSDGPDEARPPTFATPASGVDELRVSITSGPWRSDALRPTARPTGGAVLTRGPSDTTTILRTAGGVAPDGSHTTFTHTQVLR